MDRLNPRTIIRPAELSDVHQIKDLIQFGAFVHQHLDWRQASEWVGHMPYYVAERNAQLFAALACYPDQAKHAWIRLFAANTWINVDQAWRLLWQRTRSYLPHDMVIAAIAFKNWFRKVLVGSGFEHTDDVILLEWNHGYKASKTSQQSVGIRKMVSDDLNIVAEIDRLAFAPIWRHSFPMLEIAYSKAAVATVAYTDNELVGYQISTANSSGGHLARLAVLPQLQGQGIGYALVQNLIATFELWGTLKVTVNTQAKNYSSQALYQKAGFKRTEESYPVLQLSLS